VVHLLTPLSIITLQPKTKAMNGDARVAIVGSGRIGFRTARLLNERGHDVLIIERNPKRVERTLESYVATIIEGNATRPSVLKQIDLARTDVVATMTNTMATNVSVSMLVDRLAPGLHTVMRVPDGDFEEYEGLADTLVCPERAGAAAAASAILGRGERTVEGLPGQLQLLELEVVPEAPIANRMLTDITLPHGSLVVSGAAGDDIASSTTELEPGETYLVAVESGVADEVSRLFRG
jgi:trk system potassium uptake protein TrkA